MIRIEVFVVALGALALLLLHGAVAHQVRISNKCSQTIFVGILGPKPIPEDGGYVDVSSLHYTCVLFVAILISKLISLSALLM